MSTNITKELIESKVKTSTKTEQDSAVVAVKLLEAGDSMEDLRIANALGRNHNIARAQTELGRKLEMEKLDGQYAGNVYSLKQIRDLAAKYNMRFLQSKHYCGNLDVMAIQKIKEFHKETGVNIEDANLKYMFFILAPEDCFDLETVKRMRHDPDPAIFYKIDENHYRLIHQWGNDFNIFNRIAGWNWSSREGKLLVSLVSYLLIGMLLTMGVDLFVTMPKWIYAPVALFLVVISFTNAYSSFWDDADFHSVKWNSTSKLKS